MVRRLLAKLLVISNVKLQVSSADDITGSWMTCAMCTSTGHYSRHLHLPSCYRTTRTSFTVRRMFMMFMILLVLSHWFSWLKEIDYRFLSWYASCFILWFDVRKCLRSQHETPRVHLGQAAIGECLRALFKQLKVTCHMTRHEENQRSIPKHQTSSVLYRHSEPSPRKRWPFWFHNSRAKK